MRIIAYSTTLTTKGLLIEESSGESCESTSPDKLLSFLLEPYDNALKVCWSLDDTVAPLLHFIGKANCLKLAKTKRLSVPPYDFFYAPGKVFIVRHKPTEHACSLYGLDQYYTDIEPPASVKEVQWLGEYLLEELSKMGFVPTKLTSPVAIYEECAMRNFHVPTIADMPKEAAEYSYRCAGKLWIESYALGYYPQCWDYDLRSSFPMVAKDLLDFRYGKWDKLQDNWAKAVYGYFKCFVDITSDINPIIHVNDKGESSTPVGKRDCYLTKQEIEFIEQHKLGIIQVMDGWVFTPTKQVKPIEQPLEKLLSYRGKGKVQDLLAKRMSVGMYGKLGEERTNELGAYFNPCWFAEISSRVRLQVAEFIYANKLQDSLVHVSVDGLLADAQVPVPLQWRCEEASALVFSSGLVFQGTKRPHGLTLDDVLGMIAASPRKGHYEKEVQRVVTLGDAVEYKRLDDLGMVKPMYASLDFFRIQHDRAYKVLPKTGEQLLRNKYKSEAQRI